MASSRRAPHPLVLPDAPRLAALAALAALVPLVPREAGATGTLRGRITFTGHAPLPEKIDPNADFEFCSQQRLVDERLIVDAKSKGIKNVVAWVEGTKTPSSEPPSTERSAPPVIENARCRYEPHVVIATAGQEVVITNRDRLMHTSIAKDARGKVLFNVALPNKDREVKKTFPAPGVYGLSCEVHDWMQGWVVVTGGELAAISDAKGTLEILGVPAGRQKVHLWHETLGEQVLEVDVPEGKPVELKASWGRSPEPERPRRAAAKHAAP